MPTMSARTDADWMQTFTGRQFWPADPSPSDICIEDIAHALAHLCRYGGHVADFYSVAEHCCHMCEKAPPELKKWALLHDATEAYIVDMPRPVKRNLPGYSELEKRLEWAVAKRFALPLPMPAGVKELDNRILLDERKEFMCIQRHSWGQEIEALQPLGVTLLGLMPHAAENWFLELWEQVK